MKKFFYQMFGRNHTIYTDKHVKDCILNNSDYIDMNVSVLNNKQVKVYLGNKTYNIKIKDIYQYVEDLEKIFSKEKIESIIVYRPPLFGSKSYLLNKIKNEYENKTLKKDYGFNYSMTYRTIIKYFLLYVISKHCNKVILLVSDPLENYIMNYIDCNKKVEYYFLKNKDFEYLPFFEFYIMDLKNKTKNQNKKYYCFSLYTDVLDNRKDLSEIKTNKVIVKRARKQTKTMISQKDYYKMLSQSRYTIIFHSYVKTTFSIIRFFEAIANNCIPLILNNDCDSTDLKNTFKDIYDLVKKYNLFVDFNDIKKYVSNDKLYEKNKKFLEDIEKTKSFKQFSDSKYLRKLYKEKL